VCVCCLDSRRHVWLPLDFCRDFLFGITPPCCCCCRLLTPSPIFTFPPGFHHFPLCDSRRLFCAQFFCSCLFFCSVLIFFLFVRWPKVNPWAVAFLSNFYRSAMWGELWGRGTCGSPAMGAMFQAHWKIMPRQYIELMQHSSVACYFNN